MISQQQQQKKVQTCVAPNALFVLLFTTSVTFV